MATLLFQLLDPRRESLVDRQAYFLVHRQSAKSTLSTFLFPIFLTYMKDHSIFVRKNTLDWNLKDPIFEWEENDNGEVIEIKISEDYIVVCSETGSMAEDLVGDLRTVIDTRADLASLFGEKKPKMIKTDKERSDSSVWRRNTFVTADGTVVRGVGTGMQIRGRQLRGRRPSLILVDDMYSEENIKSEQSRENLNRWFFNAAVNSCDSKKGKVLWLGTMIHPDTVIKTLKKSRFWFGIQRPIISSLELRVIIDRCNDGKYFDDDDFFLSDSSKQLIKEWEKDTISMSWPAKHPLRQIMMLYKQSLDENRLAYFYQEYMCEYTAPENLLITEETFRQFDLTTYRTNGEQVVEFYDDRGILWIGQVNLSIGVDPAASRNDTSDDTAIVVGGLGRFYPKIAGRDWESVLEEMRFGMTLPVILHIEGGKYAIHNYEDMPGITERLIDLTERYAIKDIKIEAQGQQQQIVREIRSSFRLIENNAKIREEYTQIKKDERIRSIVYTLAHKYEYFVCRKLPLISKLYTQALLCGLTDHDDYADALAIAMKDTKVPPISATGFRVINTANKEKSSDWERKVKVFGPVDAWLSI